MFHDKITLKPCDKKKCYRDLDRMSAYIIVRKILFQTGTHIFTDFILGDGRMDSPGHCAQYCSYTMMDDNTKQIVSLLTLDKRQTDRKSCNLEKLGFQNTITDLRRNGCAIAEVVTDAHMQISSIMSMYFIKVKNESICARKAAYLDY